MANFVKTDDLLKDMCGIIESSREAAYKAVNTALVQRNWQNLYRENITSGCRTEGNVLSATEGSERR